MKRTSQDQVKWEQWAVNKKVNVIQPAESVFHASLASLMGNNNKSISDGGWNSNRNLFYALPGIKLRLNRIFVMILNSLGNQKKLIRRNSVWKYALFNVMKKFESNIINDRKLHKAVEAKARRMRFYPRTLPTTCFCNVWGMAREAFLLAMMIISSLCFMLFHAKVSALSSCFQSLFCFKLFPPTNVLNVYCAKGGGERVEEISLRWVQRDFITFLKKRN